MSEIALPMMKRRNGPGRKTRNTLRVVNFISPLMAQDTSL